ncbi:MAG: MaoC/PaaZ C-terminal domain-containing protein [Candidatus Binataceae bacterium]
MPLSSEIVGQRTRPFHHTVDARWLMAYCAGIDETAPCYFDTTQPIQAHPVFPACLEWDAVLALRHGPGSAAMNPQEQARAVHAEHDIHLLQSIVPGSELTTIAIAIGAEQRSPGAYLTLRLDTMDASGTLVCRTYYGTLYRDVVLIGAARMLEPVPVAPASSAPAAARHTIPIGATAAHLYTECARIWNPIHTDRAHALAAGLPDLILHGTATLARAVSAVVSNYLDVPSRIRRVGCRFSGMVMMPSTLTLDITAHDWAGVGFRVLNENGAEVIKQGFMTFDHTR